MRPRNLVGLYAISLLACSSRPPSEAASVPASSPAANDAVDGDDPPSAEGGGEPADQTEATDTPRGAFTDLGEVVLEQSLDEGLPREKRYGEGGGMASELMFTRLHWPTLRLCRERIKTVADTWANHHSLVPSTVEISDSRMMLHYGSSSPSGFFEVTYRVYPEYRSTHTYFGFYDQSLRRLTPEQIPSMIDTFALQDLVKNLQLAARCNDGATL